MIPRLDRIFVVDENIELVIRTPSQENYKWMCRSFGLNYHKLMHHMNALSTDVYELVIEAPVFRGDGRWGRRIFGTVQNIECVHASGKVDELTEFWLQFRGDRFVLSETHQAFRDDLEDDPKLYGSILNQMVERLEKAIAANTSP